MGIQGRGQDTEKGSRRAYNKGMGLLGHQGNEMADTFFFPSLPLHPPGAGDGFEPSQVRRYLASMYLPLALLRYESWQHGVVPFGTTRTANCLLFW
jgi:hypothetical protein